MFCTSELVGTIEVVAIVLLACGVLTLLMMRPPAPRMTDQQWRCYMDSRSPYAVHPHRCRRCDPNYQRTPDPPPRRPSGAGIDQWRTVHPNKKAIDDGTLVSLMHECTLSLIEIKHELRRRGIETEKPASAPDVVIEEGNTKSNVNEPPTAPRPPPPKAQTSPESSWKCNVCGQSNSWWAITCGRCNNGTRLHK